MITKLFSINQNGEDYLKNWHSFMISEVCGSVWINFPRPLILFPSLEPVCHEQLFNEVPVSAEMCTNLQYGKAQYWGPPLPPEVPQWAILSVWYVTVDMMQYAWNKQTELPNVATMCMHVVPKDLQYLCIIWDNSFL